MPAESVHVWVLAPDHVPQYHGVRGGGPTVTGTWTWASPEMLPVESSNTVLPGHGVIPVEPSGGKITPAMGLMMTAMLPVPVARHCRVVVSPADKAVRVTEAASSGGQEVPDRARPGCLGAVAGVGQRHRDLHHRVRHAGLIGNLEIEHPGARWRARRHAAHGRSAAERRRPTG